MTPQAHDVLARYHRAMRDANADDLAYLYAADAVHEFPMTFPGFPPRFEGREQVRAGYRAAWGATPARLEEIRNVVVHDTTDPSTIVVEHEVAGTIATTGAPFAAAGLLVLRVEDGQLVHVRDYLDAFALGRAAGASQA